MKNKLLIIVICGTLFSSQTIFAQVNLTESQRDQIQHCFPTTVNNNAKQEEVTKVCVKKVMQAMSAKQKLGIAIQTQTNKQYIDALLKLTNKQKNAVSNLIYANWDELSVTQQDLLKNNFANAWRNMDQKQHQSIRTMISRLQRLLSPKQQQVIVGIIGNLIPSLHNPQSASP